MKNPWIRLPHHPPYVLAEDLEVIDCFNNTAGKKVRVHTDLMPEPFIGRTDAPVVLLNLNPGFSPQDPRTHRRTAFRQTVRDNLVQRLPAFPFFFVDPDLRAPGRKWWENKLRHLLEKFGCERVANSILCIEYFPYHSERFARKCPPVPSQLFSFYLVQQAILRGALIVVMRSSNRWEQAVTDLRGYRLRYVLNSPQNVMVSPGNCPQGYERIVAAIGAAHLDSGVKLQNRANVILMAP
jgi:hypothetical protein